jgi:hypothetical protein
MFMLLTAWTFRKVHAFRCRQEVSKSVERTLSVKCHQCMLLKVKAFKIMQNNGLCMQYRKYGIFLGTDLLDSTGYYVFYTVCSF